MQELPCPLGISPLLQLEQKLGVVQFLHPEILQGMHAVWNVDKVKPLAQA